MITMRKLLQTTALMMASSLSANAATTFGPVENFDVVNDTGITAHGFQVRLHGIHTTDITSIFGDASRWPNMERYGSPTVTEGSDANGIYTDVVYQATYAGAWSSGTPSGTLPVSPSDSCWPYGAATYGPNYPCDHFGVSTSTPATSVDYNWMLETSTPGQLNIVTSNVPAPVWTVTPVAPVNNVPQPPAVAVVVKAPPKPVPYEFGEPKWVKVTATGYGYNVAVEDLVAENAASKLAQTNVQVEWQLLQTDTGNPNAGQVDLSGVAPDPGYKSIIYRFEFYQYTGKYDPETHEALSVNGDTATPAASDLGIFLVAQNAAVNLDGQAPPAAPPVAPLINNSLPDGVAGGDYGKQTVSVTGNAGDTVNVAVTGLPAGLSFDPATNIVSGTPTKIGVFQVSITATDVTNNTTVSATTPMNVTDPAIVFNVTMPDATVGSVYSYQLAATGGDAPFTYALASGTLPAGLSVSASGLISGTPTVSGTVTLAFTATDKVGVQSQSSSTNLKVILQAVACTGKNAVISFANKSWLDIAGGISQGGQSVYYAPQAGTTFAPGLTFGAFAAGQWVTYSGGLDAAGQYCLANTMAVSLPLNVPTPTFASVRVGTAFPVTAITPTGGWSPYTIAVSGLPNGLSFNGTAISGTPTVTGTFPIAISVADNKANKFNITTSTITITPPPITLGAVTFPASGTVGVAYTGQANATGGFGTLSWKGTGLPTGVSISSAGVISGTPFAAGTFNVVLTVNDSIGQVATVKGNVVIAAAPVVVGGVSCTKPAGATGGLNSMGTITAIKGNVITFKTSKAVMVSVTVPACATIQWNGGAKSFALGQAFEWNGYNSAATGNVAQSVVSN